MKATAIKNRLVLTTQRLYIKIMTGNELLKLPPKNGWRLARISGSHHIVVKDGKRSIPVPIHGNKDLPKGLVAAILKQADIKR
jgi:predicted RNA binding protein YcfA (HicA-like mRNA interferase family)